jgi:hypothetical protein
MSAVRPRGPNRNAKGNPNTRTITWGHRDNKKKEPAKNLKRQVERYTVSEKYYKLSRGRELWVLSNVEEPFIPFDKIKEALEQLSEEYDNIFHEKCGLFGTPGITVMIYHTKDNKHEDLQFDGQSWNTTGFIAITDATFDVEKTGRFGFWKKDCADKTTKWNRDINTHFFGERIFTPNFYEWTYKLEAHYNYITQFLLLHEFGHKVVFKRVVDEIGREKRDLNYNYLKEETMVNEVVIQINPTLKFIFDADIQEILYE